MVDPLERSARLMYEVLRSGGLAMACTDTGYGLIAIRSEAVRRIYALTGRAANKPCVTVGLLPILDEVATGITADRRTWLASAAERWPLAVIVRYRADAALLANVEPFVAMQTRRDDTLALVFGVGRAIRRVAELALADGELVVGASANLAGTGNHYDLADLPATLASGVDLVVRGTPRFRTPERLASTMVDFTTGAITRRGVEAAAVERAWRSHLDDRLSLAG